MTKKRNKNDEFAELPLGLAMSLAQNADAMQFFRTLTDEKKRSVVSFIQSSTTGAEAKRRVSAATEGLAHGNFEFLG